MFIVAFCGYDFVFDFTLDALFSGLALGELKINIDKITGKCMIVDSHSANMYTTSSHTLIPRPSKLPLLSEILKILREAGDKAALNVNISLYHVIHNFV